MPQIKDVRSSKRLRLLGTYVQQS